MITLRTTGEMMENSKPGAGRLLVCKCPRCRQGDMFVEKNAWKLNSTMKMNKNCPQCGQALDLEVGFYFGSGYVSYAVTVALTAVSFVAWWIVVGFSLYDNRLYWWLGINALLMIVLQPYLMRVSRTLWLAFFVGYDTNWRSNRPRPPERTNREQENNW